jgi:hypothetical protein
MSDYLVLNRGGQLSGCIHSKLPSMKNGRRILYQRTWKGTRPVSAKSQEAIAFMERVRTAYWEAIAARTLDATHVPLEGRLAIDVRVYQESRRADLDIELLCDALQGAGLIRNDRDLWEKRAVREIDRRRPRVEFTVTSSGKGS